MTPGRAMAGPTGAGAALLLALAAALPTLAAQVPPDLARDRAAYDRWLLSASLSPYAALAVQPIGTGLSIGPEPADIPIPDITRATVTETRAAAQLTQGSARRTLPANRPVDLGSGYQLVIAGPSGRRVAAAYGPIRDPQPPDYFDHQPALAYGVTLLPPNAPGGFAFWGRTGSRPKPPRRDW